MKEGEEEARATSLVTLEKTEATLLAKVQTLQNRIEHEENPDELQKLNVALAGLLENLERIRKAKKT